MSTPDVRSISKAKFSLRAKLTIAFSLIAAISSLIPALAFYATTQGQLLENFRRRVLTAVAIAALQQNGDEFDKISSQNDLLYEKFRLQNLKVLRSDPDFIFVYTLKKDQQGIYFVVDGNEPDAEGFSPYGSRYLEPSPYLVENFDSMTHPIAEPEIYTDEYGSFISAYAPILSSTGEKVGVIAIDIAANVIVQERRNILVQSLIIFLGVLTFGIILGILAGNSITKPVTKLVQVALAFASGRLDQRIDINTHDELEDLAEAFYKMSHELAQTLETLEEKVADRSRHLERRSLELETIAEVAREITIIHDLDTLLNISASLIRERFKYYHVGIFLVDERGEFAVLRAASSAAAGQMLEQNFKLKVGQEGLVGNVARTGQAHIALDVGKDAIHFQNPLLPQTRSEITLPLRSRNVTIGVLDIQADVEAAFGEQDVKVFQLLADQLAAAIENAQLVGQVETTFTELNQAHRLQTQNAWRSSINQDERPGYEYDGIQVRPIPQQLSKELLRQLENGEPILFKEDKAQEGNSAKTTLMVPIKVLNQTIGVIGLEREGNHAWADEEIAIAQAAANRAGITLENARLLEESQRRAIKERTIFDATERIGSVMNIENILYATAEEIERILGSSEVILQLNNDNVSSTNEK